MHRVSVWSRQLSPGCQVRPRYRVAFIPRWNFRGLRCRARAANSLRDAIILITSTHARAHEWRVCVLFVNQQKCESRRVERVCVTGSGDTAAASGGCVCLAPAQRASLLTLHSLHLGLEAVR